MRIVYNQKTDIMKSGFLRLNWKDVLRGFLMALIGAILTGLLTVLDQGEIPMTWAQWKPIIITGLAAGIAYLLKNFFTNSKDKMLAKEVK